MARRTRRPAVSQYSAATPDRLDWFKDYNKGKAYAEKVKPFNFLLEFYAKRPDEMARDNLLSLSDQIQAQPKPISPYSRDPYQMLAKIRDRVSGELVEQRWLRTYADTLRGYHRHPETKFLHAEATDSGPTQRRHILVETIEDIGKEADKWDEDEPLAADDEFTVSYGLSVGDRKQMMAVIQSVSKTRLHRAAHVSIRTIPTSLAEANEMPDKELQRIFAEASALAEEKRKTAELDEALLQWLVQQVNERGLKAVAELLDYDAANLAKVVAGKRKISRELRMLIVDQRGVKENNLA